MNCQFHEDKDFHEGDMVRKDSLLLVAWSMDAFDSMDEWLREWKHLQRENPTTIAEQLHILYWESILSLEQRKFEKSLNMIEKSLEIIDNTKTFPESYFLRIKFHLLKARCYLKLEQPQMASREIEIALHMANLYEECPRQLIEGLILLAQCDEKQGKIERAYHHLQQALGYIRRQEVAGQEKVLLKLKGLIQRELSVIYRQQGNLDLAIQSLQRALQIFEKINNRRQAALTSLDLAQLYLYQNDLSTSLEYHRKAEMTFRNIDDFVNLALTLSNQSRIYLRMKQLGLAIKKLQEANRYLQEGVGQPQEWNNQMLMGRIQLQQGNLTRAAYHYKEAASIARGMKNKFLEARANYDLARILFYRGKIRQARHVAENVLSAYLEQREEISAFHLALAYQLLGEIFLDGHQMYMTARYYLDRALIHARKCDNPARQVSVRLALVRIDILTHELDNARREMASIDSIIDGFPPEIVSEYHFTKGLLLDILNEHEKALEHFQQARIILSQQDNLYSQIMNLYHMGSCLIHIKALDEAQDVLQEALKISQLLDNLTYQALCHEAIARLQELNQTFVAAVNHWEQALQLYTTTEEEISKIISIYLRLIDLHEKLGNSKRMTELARDVQKLMNKIHHEMH